MASGRGPEASVIIVQDTQHQLCLRLSPSLPVDLQSTRGRANCLISAVASRLPETPSETWAQYLRDANAAGRTPTWAVAG